MTLDPVEPLRLGKLRALAVNKAKGPVPSTVKKFRNYYQESPQTSVLTELDTGDQREVGKNLILQIGAHTIMGSTFGFSAGVDEKQIGVDTNLTTKDAAERRDRVDAYEGAVELVDSDPLFNDRPGEAKWEMPGREANHLTLVWYAYEKALTDLS